MPTRRKLFLSGLALIACMFFVHTLRDWSLHVIVPTDRNPLVNGTEQVPDTPARNKGDFLRTTTPKFVPRKLLQGDTSLTDSKRGTLERIHRTNSIKTTPRPASRDNHTHLRTTPTRPPNLVYALPSTPKIEVSKPGTPIPLHIII
jgi:hypothetical protein